MTCPGRDRPAWPVFPAARGLRDRPGVSCGAGPRTWCTIC